MIPKWAVFAFVPLLQVYSEYRIRFLRGIGIAAGWLLVARIRFVVLPLVPAFRLLAIMMDLTALLLYGLAQAMVETMERRD